MPHNSSLAGASCTPRVARLAKARLRGPGKAGEPLEPRVSVRKEEKSCHSGVAITR